MATATGNDLVREKGGHLPQSRLGGVPWRCVLIHRFRVDFSRPEEHFALPYLGKSQPAWLVAHPQVEFMPGLNFLVGPNGSGKSSVLRTIGKLLHLEQSTNPVVTTGSTQDVIKYLRYDQGKYAWSDHVFLDAATVDYDGGPVRMVDAEKRPGTRHMIDTDFFSAWQATTQILRHSSGQQSSQFIEQALALPFQTVEIRGTPPWQGEQAWAKMLALLSGTESGDKRPALILDEPDRALGLVAQAQLWDQVCAFAEEHQIQVIAATHSPFALNRAGAHYIETAPGFLEAARAVCCRMGAS